MKHLVGIVLEGSANMLSRGRKQRRAVGGR